MKLLISIFVICMMPDESFCQNWLRVDSMFNPSGVAVQNFSAPAFADLNGDGVLDLLLGNGSSAKVGFFRGLGMSLPPTYLRDTSVLYSIYAGGMAGTNSDYPAACDLDGDRDVDLVIGGYNGLLYYVNIGDTVSPHWLRVDSVFAEANAHIGTDAKPAFADLDADGDLDLLVGIGESLFGGPPAGVTFGFRNTGSRLMARFTFDSTLVFGIPDIGLNSYPTLIDIDNDGDNDLLLGRDLATLVHYRNTGSPASPTWTLNTTTFFVVEGTTYWKNPTLVDIDRDGDFDLVYGTSDGTLYTYLNIGSVSSPQFQYNAGYFPVIRISGNGATVSLADFDNDNDLDFVSGDWLGRFQYFRNDGTAHLPRFTPATASFSTLDAGSYSSPVFVDLDGDTDQDIVSGALDGLIHCYINTGPGFAQNTTIFSGIDVGFMSAPAFADLDFDGDLDMIVGAEEATMLQFYKNTGDNTFVLDNSFIAGVTSVRDGQPAFVDLDADGDYDLIIGGISGGLLYFRNIGTPVLPSWSRDDALLAEVSVRQDAAAGFADMNGDGKPDVIVGEYNGNFTYFKNQLPTSVAEHSSQQSVFLLEQNYPNPFNPSTTIEYYIPAPGFVSIRVFDVLGREVTTLVDDEKGVGRHSVVFNASNLASGVYYYRLHSGNILAARRILLIR
jgi:hypothetical protein